MLVGGVFLLWFHVIGWFCMPVGGNLHLTIVVFQKIQSENILAAWINCVFLYRNRSGCPHTQTVPLLSLVWQFCTLSPCTRTHIHTIWTAPGKSVAYLYRSYKEVVVQGRRRLQAAENNFVSTVHNMDVTFSLRWTVEMNKTQFFI